MSRGAGRLANRGCAGRVRGEWEWCWVGTGHDARSSGLPPLPIMPKSAYHPSTPFRRLPLRPVVWVRTSLVDLQRLPAEVTADIGYTLHLVQLDEYPESAKLLRGDLGGLVELIADHGGNAYRAVFTVKLRHAIYVLHVFQKKSTHGIATSRRDIELIKSRLSVARELDAERDLDSEEPR